jgi:hypothetical protein
MKLNGKYVPPLTPEEGVQILEDAQRPGAERRYSYSYKRDTFFRLHCKTRMMKFSKWRMEPTVIFPLGTRVYETGFIVKMCPMCGYYFEDHGSYECY